MNPDEGKPEDESEGRQTWQPYLPGLGPEADPHNEGDYEPAAEPEGLPEREIGAPSSGDVDYKESEPQRKAVTLQLWAAVLISIWILALYIAFYYLLVSHRFEKFYLGG